MAIAAYFHPKNMTWDQYRDIHARLEKVGLGLRDQHGRLHHSCFGADGDLMVYDIWESPEAFQAFGEKLMPILAEVGVEVPPPDVIPCRFLDQEEVLGKF
jgi:hypothetical protein